MSKADKNKSKKEVKKEEVEPVFEELTGEGKFIFPNKSLYIGEYKQLKTGVKVREGKGKFYQPGYEMTLDKLKESAFDPKTSTNDNANTKKIGAEYYDGEWKNDKMEGYGIYHYSNGDIYEGKWKNGLQYGKGKYTFADGTSYEGEWEDHKMSGSGSFSGMDKNRGVKGEFVDGTFKSEDQSDLKENKRISIIVQGLKEVPFQFKKSWDEACGVDAKQLTEALAAFFANKDNMGQFFNNVEFPVYESQKPKYWMDIIKWVFEEESDKGAAKKGGKEEVSEPQVEKLRINIPKNSEECQILEKGALLAPQLNSELDNGQVVEMFAQFKDRLVKLVLGYNAAAKRWLIVYLNDGKVAK